MRLGELVGTSSTDDLNARREHLRLVNGGTTFFITAEARTAGIITKS